MSGFFNKLFGNPDGSGLAPEGVAGAQYGAGEAPVHGARPFSVSELANMLPPEFVRLQGVDVNREVALDLGTARRTMAEGRPAVMLSEIYRACPEIFPREVTVDEDFEVRLPVARVRSLLGVTGSVSPVSASPFQAVRSSLRPPARRPRHSKRRRLRLRRPRRSRRWRQPQPRRLRRSKRWQLRHLRPRRSRR